MNTARTIALLLLACLSAGAEDLAPAVQAKVEAQIKDIQAWAGDPVIVKAVQDHNRQLPADQAGLTQEKWQALSILDPLVRSFAKNEAGQLLKAKKTEAVSEAFLSDAAGYKVAFLSKPSNWCHKDKPKHEQPMAGKLWQGPVEVDESTGLQQVQVAVPVVDGGKPVGSLIVGLSLTKLAK